MEKLNNKYLLLFVDFVLAFFVSFFEINGAYFVVGVPYALTRLIHSEKRFFCAFLGVITSSFFMGNSMYFLTIMLLLITLIYLITIRKTKIDIPTLFTFCMGVDSLVYLAFYNKVLNYNLKALLAPIFIAILLTYFLSSLNVKIRSREKFSITRIEAVFVFSFINLVVLKNQLIFANINISILLASLFIYAAIRVNSKLGCLLYLISLLFFETEQLAFFAILLGAGLIFLMKFVMAHKNAGVFLYWTIALVDMYAFSNYENLLTIFLVGLMMLLIKNSFFIYLQGYVIDPKDYKIKDYQDRYNAIINKNKTINFLVSSIKEKVDKSSRMSKKGAEKILSQLSVLMDKINNEEVVDFKQKIKDDIEYVGIDVVSLKVNEVGEDITFEIEIRGYSESELIINCIENTIKRRFNIERGEYNFLTNITKYVFKNTDEYKFDYYVKQRSVDIKCGDNYMSFSSDGNKYFLVSDGMGHGEKADDESKFSLFLLRKFIELGMNVEEAIKACNNLVCSNNDNYNTLDLLEYDGFTNEMILYKNGSGNSYVQYGERVDNLLSENLPLGIVEDIEVKRIDIGKNVDRIVLTSDGIKGDISSIIKQSNKKSLKLLVDEILDKNKEIDDDQTIMAINVIKK